MRTRNKQKSISSADAAFMNDVQASLMAQSAAGSKLVIFIIMLILAVGLTWAKFALVEEITRGEATVISKSREQIIQSLEGGILAEMNIHEGDIVEAGQVLLKIDPKKAQSSYRESLTKVIGLKATIARLRAEAYGIPLVFDEQVQTEPEVVDHETLAYEARRKALNDSVISLEKSYQLATREISLAAPLAKQGLLSEVELLRMQRQANDILSQITERKNRYQAESNSELIKLELELSQTSENLIGRSDVLERTTLLAPVKGTVKNVRINTIGGVIQPGERIMEIIPLEEQLLVETKIKPSDVAFLRPGLPAMVKISAYDFSIYGGLKGKVELISPDTIDDDKKVATGRPDATYYRVMILTDKSYLEVKGDNLPIIPGMVASVEIRTGEKTILDYLLKPVFKAKEAFRER